MCGRVVEGAGGDSGLDIESNVKTVVLTIVFLYK